MQTLINRLEKNRGMKPEERANIMKTLKELADKITQLQNEMNPASQVSSARTNHSQPKTKTDVSCGHKPVRKHQVLIGGLFSTTFYLSCFL